MCGARSQCSVSRSSPAVWGRKRESNGQLLMPALQACCLRGAFVLQVHVAQREELIGGRPRRWVHEEREVARLRQSSLPAVAHAHCQKHADAVVVRSLQKRPHVCPGNSSSEEKPSLAEDSSGDVTPATTRDMKLPVVRGDAGGNSELEQVQHMFEQNITQLLRRRGSWAETPEMGSGATWTRQGTQNFPRNTVETCSALGARHETQQHVAQGQQPPKSRSTRSVAERRPSHHTTTVQTTHGAEH